MKCPKCGKSYDDSFKFCPECAEANPLLQESPEKPAETSQVVLAGQPLAKEEAALGVAPAAPPIPQPPEPTRTRGRFSKRTWIIASVCTLAAIAGLVFGLVFGLGGGRDTSTPGKAILGHWENPNGNDQFFNGSQNLSVNLDSGDRSGTTNDYTVKKEDIVNRKLELQFNFGAGVSFVNSYQFTKDYKSFTLTVASDLLGENSVLGDSAVYTYIGPEMAPSLAPAGPVSKTADDFISIDNVHDGQELYVGPSIITGTRKADCSVTMNGQPLGITADGKFQPTIDLVEGNNVLNFVVTDTQEKTYKKSITIKGILTPDVYKAVSPAGPDFAHLNKSPDTYAGTRCMYKGQIVQIMEGVGETNIRMNITPMGYGYWTDTIYVVLAGKTPAVEEDIVIVYGTIRGSYTYTSTANYKITLPCIDAKYVDISQ